MPTLTPPDLDRNRTAREDDGGGRRPPTPPRDKRTGGNGEGDSSNEPASRTNNPRARLSRARIGMFFALFVVAMVFVSLITVFIVTKASGHFVPSGPYDLPWRPTEVPRILWLNTALLLLSAFTAEAARRRMFREHDLMEEWLGIGRPISGRATIWLSITLMLGLAFLAGQIIAWREIAGRLAYLRNNPSAHFFNLLTATHAFHLVAGIAALIAALIVLNRSRAIATRQVVVDSTVWYWHAMGILWLALFALLEFGQ